MQSSAGSRAQAACGRMGPVRDDEEAERGSLGLRPPSTIEVALIGGSSQALIAGFRRAAATALSRRMIVRIPASSKNRRCPCCTQE